jgi:hypothetical protein
MKPLSIILVFVSFFALASENYYQKFTDFKNLSDKSTYFTEIKKNEVWKLIEKSCDRFLSKSHLICLWQNQFLQLEKIVKSHLDGGEYKTNIEFYRNAYKKNPDSDVYMQLSIEVNKTLFLWHGVASFLLKEKTNFIRAYTNEESMKNWFFDMTHLMSFINTFDIYTYNLQNYIWFKRYNNLDASLFVSEIEVYTESLNTIPPTQKSTYSFNDREFKDRDFQIMISNLSKLYDNALTSKLIPVERELSLYTIDIKKFSSDFENNYEVTFMLVEQSCKKSVQSVDNFQFTLKNTKNDSFCERIPDRNSSFQSELYQRNCSEDSEMYPINLSILIKGLPENERELSEYCSIAYEEYQYRNKKIFKALSNHLFDSMGLQNMSTKTVMSEIGKKFLLDKKLLEANKIEKKTVLNIFDRDFL